MSIESQDGPFVSVACICQTPLREATGHLSVIRITDRIQIIGTEPQMQPQPLMNLMLVIVLRSGVLRETYTLTVTTVAPNGQSSPHNPISVLFEGEDRGPAIISPLILVATEAGLYWIEIALEGKLLTKIPLRVQYQKAQGIPQFPFPPPNPRGM
jgi:hypothetical protein